MAGEARDFGGGMEGRRTKDEGRGVWHVLAKSSLNLNFNFKCHNFPSMYSLRRPCIVEAVVAF